MVQLDEGVEAVLRVGLAALAAENLVGRGRAVGMHSLRPAQVGFTTVGIVEGCVLGVGARERRAT